MAFIPPPSGGGFQPPSFAQPKQYPNLPQTIDSLFETYQRAKLGESQLALNQQQLSQAKQGQEQAAASFALQNQGLTPNDVTRFLPQAQASPSPMLTGPAQDANPLYLRPQSSQPSYMNPLNMNAGQQTPGQNLEDPKVGILRNILAMHAQSQQMGAAQQGAQLQATQAGAVEKMAGAQKSLAEAEAMRGGYGQYKPNATEYAARGYADKAEQANRYLAQLEGQGLSLGTGLQASAYTPNILKSGQIQEFDQAKRQFVNAVLRRESGAAISASELDNYSRQYFPVAGDSDDVKAHKAESRRLAIAALGAEGARVPSSLSKDTGVNQGAASIIQAGLSSGKSRDQIKAELKAAGH
jgi:hypothetical protein